MSHGTGMACMLRLDALMVLRVELMQGVGRVVVEWHLTGCGVGAAIELGVRPRLVPGVVHALSRTSGGASIGGLRARMRTWREATEEIVQEGLVCDRILWRGLDEEEIANVLLKIPTTICHLITMSDGHLQT